MMTEKEIRKEIADLEQCRDSMHKTALCELCGYDIQIRTLKRVLGEKE